MPRRQESEPLEQKAAETLPLELVIDREGDFGGGLVASDVGAGRDDPGRALDDPAHDQRELSPGIGRIALPPEQSLRRVGGREEAAALRLGRELMEELAESRRDLPAPTGG